LYSALFQLVACLEMQYQFSINESFIDKTNEGTTKPEVLLLAFQNDRAKSSGLGRGRSTRYYL